MAITELNIEVVAESELESNAISGDLALQYLEYAPDGVLLQNVAGVYEYANDTICRMLGYGKEELLGNTHEILLDVVNVCKARNPFKPRNAIGIHYDEYRLIRKDNSKFIALVSVSKVEDKFLIFVKDIDGYVQSKRELIIANQSKAEQIAELDRKYRLIVENTSDGIMLFEGGSISYVSDNYLNILGYSSAEEIGRNRQGILSIIHPDDRNRIDKMVEFAIESKLPKLVYEYRAKHKSGHHIWREDTTTFVYDDNGEVKRCLIVARDVSTRKAAEQDLIHRERKYRNIFENIQDVYYEIELDGTIIEVSPSISQVTNSLITREELIGKSVYDFYYLKSQREQFIDELTNSGYIKNYEITLQNIDGSLIECSLVAKIIKDSNCKGQKIIGSIKDITDEVNARREIVQLNKSLEQKIIDQTLALKVAIEDLEIKNLELKTLNHQVYSDSVEILKLNKQLLATQEKIERANTELEHKVKLRTQELEIAKNRAEESDKLKSAFLSNLSHEIRTPLNGILGCADLLQDANNTKEEIRDFYVCLKLSSNRLLKTVEDIIEAASLKAGTAKVVQHDFNPVTIIYELYELHKEIIYSNTAIEFWYNIPDYCTQLSVKSDELKIFQIMNNLINNAIKYTHSGTIKFGIEQEFANVEFYVEDTGIGISEESLMRIFDRFYQEDSSFTRKYEGNGLGLSIAKGYVEILGGAMYVNSEQGKGSRFGFTIPMKGKISTR